MSLFSKLFGDANQKYLKNVQPLIEKINQFEKEYERFSDTQLKEKTEEFKHRFANPYVAAERGYVDAVIQPHETRARVIRALEMLDTKRDKNPPKKHGNIPL